MAAEKFFYRRKIKTFVLVLSRHLITHTQKSK